MLLGNVRAVAVAGFAMRNLLRMVDCCSMRCPVTGKVAVNIRGKIKAKEFSRGRRGKCEGRKDLVANERTRFGDVRVEFVNQVAVLLFDDTTL